MALRYIEEAAPTKLIVTDNVAHKIAVLMASEPNVEIGGAGYVEGNEWTRIWCGTTEASVGEHEMSAESLANITMEALKAGLKPAGLRLYWHTHGVHGFAPSFSQVDWDTIYKQASHGLRIVNVVFGGLTKYDAVEAWKITPARYVVRNVELEWRLRDDKGYWDWASRFLDGTGIRKKRMPGVSLGYGHGGAAQSPGVPVHKGPGWPFEDRGDWSAWDL